MTLGHAGLVICVVVYQLKTAVVWPVWQVMPDELSKGAKEKKKKIV